MLPILSEIKKRRKLLDLTQGDLAKLSEISQSLIAKIEAGKLEPTYNKAVKIFTVLDNLSHRKTKKAKDIMNTKIIKLECNDYLKKAIDTMKKHEISQMPVYDDDKMVGYISESLLLEAIIKGKESKVCDIMGERPPTVSEDAPVEIVSSLLKYSPLVIVFGGRKAKGVITKSDVLNNV